MVAQISSRDLGCSELPGLFNVRGMVANERSNIGIAADKFRYDQSGKSARGANNQDGWIGCSHIISFHQACLSGLLAGK
jgi:hypothetical protein